MDASGCHANKTGWLSFFRDVEYSRLGLRHRSNELGTKAQEQNP
jgi:hypothetical protein